MNLRERRKGIIEFTKETAAASGQQRKVDHLVYALHGLTPEEIKIVDESAH